MKCQKYPGGHLGLSARAVCCVSTEQREQEAGHKLPQEERQKQAFVQGTTPFENLHHCTHVNVAQFPKNCSVISGKWFVGAMS